MTITAVLCLFALLLATYKLYWKLKQRAYKLPPGPRGLPFLGNNLQIAKNAPAQLSKWAKEYGKLYTITIGNGCPALVVSDVKLMRQLFGTAASTGKFQSEIFDKLYNGPNGVVNSEGHVWQEQRNFCVKSLNTLGFGRGKQLESMILSEVDRLGDWLQKEMKDKGKVYLNEILKESSGNTLWTIVTGESICVVDLIEDWMTKMQKAANSGLAFFSWIKYLVPESSGYNAYVQACRKIHKFAERCFAENKMKLSKGGSNGGMVSAYIEHMDKMKDNVASSFYGEAGLRHSIQSVVGLLMAGTEVTATTLHWLIFYLSVHPNVQKRAHEEIAKMIGGERDPTTDDRKRMPYTEAMILETLRMSSSIPFGIIHRLLEQVQFGEYTLPKGMLLIANIYHVHNDTSIWGDPENFRPERFLDSSRDSQLNNMKDFIVAFQPGKRVCLGESMAKDLIFLVIVKLLQSFSFQPEPASTKEMYMEPHVGYVLAPKNHPVIASKLF